MFERGYDGQGVCSSLHERGGGDVSEDAACGTTEPWVSEDQTIPSNVKRSIDSRASGGSADADANVTVHALTLDTNFAAMDAGKYIILSISSSSSSRY